jgi:hypothetical protein
MPFLLGHPKNPLTVTWRYVSSLLRPASPAGLPIVNVPPLIRTKPSGTGRWDGAVGWTGADAGCACRGRCAAGGVWAWSARTGIHTSRVHTYLRKLVHARKGVVAGTQEFRSVVFLFWHIRRIFFIKSRLTLQDTGTVAILILYTVTVPGIIPRHRSRYYTLYGTRTLYWSYTYTQYYRLVNISGKNKIMAIYLWKR